MTTSFPRFATLRRSAGFALLMGLLTLVGCSTIDSATGSIASRFTPYRPEVVQGNVVTKEQVALLKPGLSKLQARQILGTPLITSAFHEDRWDYVFTIDRQGTEPQRRRLTLRFTGERLDKFEGDTMLSETEFIASISKFAKAGTPPRLEATPEELARYQSAPVATQPMPLPAPARSYPPLESGAAR